MVILMYRKKIKIKLLMPNWKSKPPLNGDCYRCKNQLLIKFVPRKKKYSFKNNLDFWTKKETDKELKICDPCLKELYTNKNYKKEYYQLITSSAAKKTLNVYISRQNN